MRITKEQLKVVDSLRCERLTSEPGNRQLVQGFDNSINPNLADYLKNEAWEEDFRGDVSYYLVKNPVGDVLFYFSLKCGAMFEDFNEQRMEKEYRFWKELKNILEQSIDGDENFQKVRSIIENLYMGREVQDDALRDVVKKLSAPVKHKMDMLLQDRKMDRNKNIVRVSATLAGIELVQFCANDKTKSYWQSLGFHQTLGRVVFWTKIVPLVMQVKSIAGCFMVIDKELLDRVSKQAKANQRLRMNYNFHQSLDEKCHRFLNAVEPGTVVEIHRHPTKDETFVLLRGRVVVYTYNDDGSVLESVELNPNEGRYGVNIPKGVWHTLEALELSVIFECKEGPFVPHEIDGVLRLQP